MHVYIQKKIDEKSSSPLHTFHTHTHIYIYLDDLIDWMNWSTRNKDLCVKSVSRLIAHQREFDQGMCMYMCTYIYVTVRGE